METKSQWQPMSTAPKDRPILGLCIHNKDKYWDGGKLTVYAAHCEGLSRVSDGPHVVEWGGEYTEYESETGAGFMIPDWWFRAGSDFEEVANPVAWAPIPDYELSNSELDNAPAGE